MLDSFECNQILALLDSNVEQFSDNEQREVRQFLNACINANDYVNEARNPNSSTMLAYANLKPVSFSAQKLFGGFTNIDRSLCLSIYPSKQNEECSTADEDNPHLSLLITKRQLADLIFDRNSSKLTPVTFTEFNGAPLPSPVEFVSNYERYNSKVLSKLNEYTESATRLVDEAAKLQNKDVNLTKSAKSPTLTIAKRIKSHASNNFNHETCTNRQKMEADFNYIRSEITSQSVEAPAIENKKSCYKSTPFNHYFKAQTNSGVGKILAKLLELSNDEELKHDLESYVDRHLSEERGSVNQNTFISNGYISITTANGSPFIHGDNFGSSSFINLEIGFGAEEIDHMGERKVYEAAPLMQIAMTKYQFMDLFYGSETGVHTPCSIHNILFHSLPVPTCNDKNDEVKVSTSKDTPVNQTIIELSEILVNLLEGKSTSAKVRTEILEVSEKLASYIPDDAKFKFENYQGSQSQTFSNLVKRNVNILANEGSLHVDYQQKLISALQKFV